MATTQLDRIEAMLVTQGRKLDELLAIGRTNLIGELNTASNLDTLITAVAALNTATSQEATLLQTAVDGIGGISTALSGATTTIAAEGTKLDAIQKVIDDLRQTAGVPQSLLDQLASVQSQVGGVNTSLAYWSTAGRTTTTCVSVSAFGRFASSSRSRRATVITPDSSRSLGTSPASTRRYTSE